MKQGVLALRAAENAFNAAMISYIVSRIRDCITADRDLVTPECGPISGEDALGAIGRGVLGHHMMVKQGHLIRICGDIGMVTGRGQNAGWFRSAPIAADEGITDQYRRIDATWRCDLITCTTPPKCDS